MSYYQMTPPEVSRTKWGELETLNWDFTSSDTQYATHGLHLYPARMVPQIPDRIFRNFLDCGVLDPGDQVFDPFAGSGTTGVEARFHGLNSLLIDINPLAVLLSKTKTTTVPLECLFTAWKDLLGGQYITTDISLEVALAQIAVRYNNGGEPEVEPLEVNQRYEWYPKPQLFQLAYLREQITNLEDDYDEAVVQIFRVALSETSRVVSYQRLDEYKRYRLPKKEWHNHNPDVLRIFRDKFSKNGKRIARFNSRAISSTECTVFQGDSKYAEEYIEENSVDFVLTSPPYGDHETTVAYGQFSLDPAVISMDIDRETMKQVDKKGLGGNDSSLEDLETMAGLSESLAETVVTLDSKEGRAKDALSFFRDYFEVLKQIRQALKPCKYAVLVVANRTVSQVQIPTNQITIELGEYLGLNIQQIIPRNLKNKCLPYRNGLENIKGEKVDLMSTENILVFKNKY